MVLIMPVQIWFIIIIIIIIMNHTLLVQDKIQGLHALGYNVTWYNVYKNYKQWKFILTLMLCCKNKLHF
jgi:hypothetical protein